MASEQKTLIAPDSYRKLSEPFESMEAAEKALTAFWNDVYELRNKHKIADAYIVCQVAAATSSGGEGLVRLAMHAGDVMQAESLAAYAFGQETLRRQERIAEITKAFIKDNKRRN